MRQNVRSMPSYCVLALRTICCFFPRNVTCKLVAEYHMEVSRGRVSPLYKHLIHCEYPTLCCVGVPRLAAVPKLVVDQVRYYKAVLEGEPGDIT